MGALTFGRRWWLGAAFASVCVTRVSAQEAHQIDAAELAKQTQNPVADLIALPFQFNFNNGGDFADRTFFNLGAPCEL